MGASRDEIIALAHEILKPPTKIEQSLDFSGRGYPPAPWAVVYAHYFARLLGRDLVTKLGDDFVRAFGPGYLTNFAGYFESIFQEHRKSYLATRSLDPAFACKFARQFLEPSSTYCTRDFMRELLGRLAQAPWLPEFVFMEMLNVGRMGTAVALAAFPIASSHPAWPLIKHACLLPLDSSAAPQFETALKTWPTDNEPIWPALARLRARVDSDMDRQLLADAASHPERYPAPLCWGLQYYVRGDVLLNTGEELTLDEITRSLKIGPLPYVDKSAL